jgi:hypothetical protein
MFHHHHLKQFLENITRGTNSHQCNNYHEFHSISNIPKTQFFIRIDGETNW